jgi:hypothetical protein
MTTLDDTQWLEFEANGFLRLGRELSDAELAALQQRIDDIMLGKADVDYDRMLMQLDGNVDRDRMKQVMEGETEQDDYCTAYPQSNGHKGATLNYRKIQDLEYDPVYLEYLSRPLFRGICNHVYGTGRRIAIYRAMLMNKPAGAGSYLPWHHDRWAELARDPLITVWTALDPATRESGCLQIIPGSHKRLINPDGFLTAEEADEHCDHDAIHFLELDAGESALLHNWLLHTSDRNASKRPRRAFSICYMDAATCDSTGKSYNIVFDSGALV